MQNQQILNQQQQTQDLSSISDALIRAYQGSSKEISYPDIYNCVYKLCKKGQSQQIMAELDKVSETHLKQVIDQIDKEGDSLKAERFLSTIGNFSEAAQRISEIMLYLESNYLSNKKDQSTIKSILHNKFFQKLLENQRILQRVANIVCDQRINNNNQLAISLIETINVLDSQQKFFAEFVFIPYQQKLSNDYKNIFDKSYNNQQFDQFLSSTKDHMKCEKEWLIKNCKRNKNKKLVDQCFKKVYECSLEELFIKIYKEKQVELMETHTMRFLQLLNQKQQEKEVNDFNDWYLGQIKNRLALIDRTNNTQFLQEFVQQYLKITSYLSNVKNFNITYKATFFMEHWINEDKNHFAKRLSIYLEQLIIHNSKGEIGLNNFVILFKFLKEKDYLQREFRRMCAIRYIYDRTKTGSQMETKMIDAMENQCGSDWVEKIKNLRSGSQELLSTSSNFKVLTFEDVSCPFPKIKNPPTLPQEFFKSVGDYKQNYELMFKGRLLQWYPLQGFVQLSIKFSSHKQNFRMDMVMATLILNLQSLNYNSNIKEVLGKTNLSLQDSIQQLQLLQKQKIIQIGGGLRLPQALTFSISLNANYETNRSNEEIDFTKRYLDEVFVEKMDHEELKAQRKMMVQAMVVKILKSNKSLTKQKLYSQIGPMIQSRGFKFNQSFVDNVFDVLIDKRYIRDGEDGTYMYLPS